MGPKPADSTPAKKRHRDQKISAQTEETHSEADDADLLLPDDHYIG